MTRTVGFALPSMRRFRGRLVDQRSIREQLVSVAGLIGRPVELAGGIEVGRVVDVIARPEESRGAACERPRRAYRTAQGVRTR